MNEDDLIMAFFPCIYFECMSQIAFSIYSHNYSKLPLKERFEKVFERDRNRQYFYQLLYKFIFVCLDRKLRMVFENPWAMQHYLRGNFIKEPDIIDFDRTQRGDYVKKTTAYWFWNCEPTHGKTIQPYKGEKKKMINMKHGAHAGLCSEERSMISPDYARNFIHDFILGKPQKMSQLTLFE